MWFLSLEITDWVLWDSSQQRMKIALETMDLKINSSCLNGFKRILKSSEVMATQLQFSVVSFLLPIKAQIEEKFLESAGGASVNYHMFSSMSRGLFHRAISQSGTILDVWAVPARKGDAKMKAIRLADKMKCPIVGTSVKGMLDCLRKVPAENITLAIHDFLVTKINVYRQFLR